MNASFVRKIFLPISFIGIIISGAVWVCIVHMTKCLSLEGITFSLYRGPREAEPYLTILPEMGQRLWAGYPYFYTIDLSKGYENVGIYQQSQELITLVARDKKNNVIGLLFGLPLRDGKIQRFSPYQRIVEVLGDTFNNCFYIGETLVEPNFRHRGIALHFYEMLEDELKENGKYNRIVRLLLEQPKKHPLTSKKFGQRPEKLKDMGYAKTDTIVYSSWQILGENSEKTIEEHDYPYRLWIKDLPKKPDVKSKNTQIKTISVYKGKAAHPYLYNITNMRVALFKGFPYLWDAGTKYADYTFKSYFSSGLILVLAKDEAGVVVGLIVGMPLKDAGDLGILESTFQGKLEAPFESFFYLSDLLAKKGYQNDGVYRALYQRFEDEVRALWSYKHIGIFIIKRAFDDPRRPHNFVSYEETLMKNVAFKPTEHEVTIPWDTFQADGSTHEEQNVLMFWEKAL